MCSNVHRPNEIRAALVLMLQKEKRGFKETPRLLTTAKLAREQQSQAENPGKLASSLRKGRLMMHDGRAGD